MATFKIKVTKGVDNSLDKEALDAAGTELVQVFQDLILPSGITEDYEVVISCDVVEKPTGRVLANVKSSSNHKGIHNENTEEAASDG